MYGNLASSSVMDGSPQGNPFSYNIPENQALPIYYIDWDPDLTAGRPLFIILTENQGVAT